MKTVVAALLIVSLASSVYAEDNLITDVACLVQTTVNNVTITVLDQIIDLQDSATGIAQIVLPLLFNLLETILNLAGSVLSTVLSIVLSFVGGGMFSDFADVLSLGDMTGFGSSLRGLLENSTSGLDQFVIAQTLRGFFPLGGDVACADSLCEPLVRIANKLNGRFACANATYLAPLPQIVDLTTNLVDPVCNGLINTPTTILNALSLLKPQSA